VTLPEKLEKTCIVSVNVAVTGRPPSTTVTVAGPVISKKFGLGFMMFIVLTIGICNVTVPLNGNPPRVPEAVAVSV
jgi:hypothetical protein